MSGAHRDHGKILADLKGNGRTCYSADPGAQANGFDGVGHCVGQEDPKRLLRR